MEHNCVDSDDIKRGSDYFSMNCQLIHTTLDPMLDCPQSYKDTWESNQSKYGYDGGGNSRTEDPVSSAGMTAPSSTGESKTTSGEADSTLTTQTSSQNRPPEISPAETSLGLDGADKGSGNDGDDGDNGGDDGGGGGGRNDIALALGTGLGLGIPLTIGSGGLIFFLFWRTRRRDKNLAEGSQQMDSPGSGEGLEVIAGGKTGERVMSEVPALSEMPGSERWSEAPTAQELSSEPRRISEMP